MAIPLTDVDLVPFDPPVLGGLEATGDFLIIDGVLHQRWRKFGGRSESEWRPVSSTETRK